MQKISKAPAQSLIAVVLFILGVLFLVALILAPTAPITGGILVMFFIAVFVLLVTEFHPKPKAQ